MTNITITLDRLSVFNTLRNIFIVLGVVMTLLLNYVIFLVREDHASILPPFVYALYIITNLLIISTTIGLFLLSTNTESNDMDDINQPDKF